MKVLVFFGNIDGQELRDPTKIDDFWGIPNQSKREQKLKDKLSKVREKKRQIVDVIVTILQILTLKQGEKNAEGGDLERLKKLIQMEQDSDEGQIDEYRAYDSIA